jgi:hypothetical protein
MRRGWGAAKKRKLLVGLVWSGLVWSGQVWLGLAGSCGHSRHGDATHQETRRSEVVDRADVTPTPDLPEPPFANSRSR